MNEDLARAPEARLAAEALDSEHREMAQLLHDTLSQSLSAAGIYARLNQSALERSCPDASPSAVALQEVLSSAADELQGLIRWLTPPRLGDADLLDGLAELRALTSRSVPCELHCDREALAAPETEAELLRVAQLSLHRLVRRSGATAIEIELDIDQPNIFLIVRALGANAVPSDFVSLLEHRAQTFGGSVTAHHEAEHGVTLTCRFPTRTTG